MADEAHSTTVTGTEKQTSEEQPGSKATGMQSGDHSSEGVKETAPGSEEVNEGMSNEKSVMTHILKHLLPHSSTNKWC